MDIHNGDESSQSHYRIIGFSVSRLKSDALQLSEVGSVDLLPISDPTLFLPRSAALAPFPRRETSQRRQCSQGMLFRSVVSHQTTDAKDDRKMSLQNW